MLVRITKEAWAAWQNFSQREIPYRERRGDLVEIDLPDEAYDKIVSGRLQGETLSVLMLRYCAACVDGGQSDPA